jgi:hypothetical protein
VITSYFKNGKKSFEIDTNGETDPAKYRKLREWNKAGVLLQDINVKERTGTTYYPVSGKKHIVLTKKKRTEYRENGSKMD